MTIEQIMGLGGFLLILTVGLALMFGNWKRKPGYPDEGDPAPIAQGIPAAPAEGASEWG